MPTIQVSPTASELLQYVADTLGKSKKVVVVTGAGISTNSGIPDFRSHHGLYSLIQAQFEKAAASGSQRGDSESVDGDNAERASKRRRISKTQQMAIYSSRSSQASSSSSTVPTPRNMFPGLNTGVRSEANSTPQSPLREQADVGMQQASMPRPVQVTRHARSSTSSMRPELSQNPPDSSAQTSQSNEIGLSPPEILAASQTDLSSDPIVPSALSTPRKKSIAGKYLGSSPLSSPPPVLFDPYEGSGLHSTENSSQIDYETEDSDSEESLSPSELFSSQNSRSGLRNMKGRDLFDVNIWSDPLKTSVFYRFATSLRQKVKEVEPTTTHRFIARLRDVGKLSRVYTQNIDEIEKKIGLSTDLKTGAGGKKRKSMKSQQSTEEDADTKEASDAKDEDDSCGKDSGQSSQSEEGETSKPKITYVQEKGVECVFLHGSLHALRCFQCAQTCDWDEDREMRTMSGEQPDCPHCRGATVARQEKGKRALGIGKLRPDIVLYGEEHPQSDLISPIVQHDLSAGPDLLLVLGTSLRVHGLKTMVREFAKAVHTKGGKVVFVNFTKPAESTWGDVIDYWVEWDCDAWVDDLKERKPVLWMSPEAIADHEKLKRDAIATEKNEKKRESILNKRRRDSFSGKKRDSTGQMKRRETLDVTEPKEPKAPPKNPASQRNDMFCGAYCMSTIEEAFSAIRGQPINLFNYHPLPKTRPVPKPPSTTKTSGQKERHARPRHSAPSNLSATVDHEPPQKLEIKPRPSLTMPKPPAWNGSASMSEFDLRASSSSRYGTRPAIKASAFQLPYNMGKNNQAVRSDLSNPLPQQAHKTLAGLCGDNERFQQGVGYLLANNTPVGAETLARHWGSSEAANNNLIAKMGLEAHSTQEALARVQDSQPAIRGSTHNPPLELGQQEGMLSQHGGISSADTRISSEQTKSIARPRAKGPSGIRRQRATRVGDLKATESLKNETPEDVQGSAQGSGKLAETPASGTSDPEPVSISAAVKTNPRVRKRKTLFDSIVEPSVAAPRRSQSRAASAKPRPAAPTGEDEHESINRLPPIRSDRRAEPVCPPLATLEPMLDVSPKSPLETRHQFPPSPQGSSPPISHACFSGFQYQYPLGISDALGDWGYKANVDFTVRVPPVRDSPLARIGTGLHSPPDQLNDIDAGTPLRTSAFPRPLPQRDQRAAEQNVMNVMEWREQTMYGE